MNLDIVKKIVQAGVQAPSGDNCQPLRFVWRDPVLEIHEISERGRGFLNFENVATWFTLGAALKNMSLVAKNLGFGMTSHIHGNSQSTLMASLQLTPAENSDELLASFMDKRVTNRKRYEETEISLEKRNEMIQCLNESERKKLIFVDQKSILGSIVNGVAVSEAIAIFTKEAHDYLFRFIRWSERSIRKTRDGMPVNSFELPIHEKISMWTMRSWRATFVNLMFGVDKVFCWLRRQVYLKTPCFGLVVANDFSPKSMVAAGEMTELLWLKATEMNLAFHGMMGFPLLAYLSKSSQAHKIPSQFRKTLDHSMQDLKKSLPEIGDRKVVFLFRLGKASEPTARTLRRRLDDVFSVEGKI